MADSTKSSGQGPTFLQALGVSAYSSPGYQLANQPGFLRSGRSSIRTVGGFPVFPNRYNKDSATISTRFLGRRRVQGRL